MTELEEKRNKFLSQAKTFRALAKMLSKDPRKEVDVKLCEGMAEIAESMADFVTEQMGKP